MMITVQDLDCLYLTAFHAVEQAKAGRREEGEALLRDGGADALRDRPDPGDLERLWTWTLNSFREQFPAGVRK